MKGWSVVSNNDHQPMESPEKLDACQTRDLLQPWGYQRRRNLSRVGAAPRSGVEPYTRPETASYSKFKRRSRLPRFNRHCQVGFVYANWKLPAEVITMLIFSSRSSALSRRLSSNLEKQIWAIGRFGPSKTLTRISG
jgi:hypothetical protein